MSLRINTNVASLNGHRQMLKNDATISKSLEKLSSGLKINRAADNAAGLIISEQLRAQLAGINQAMDNTEQAISMVQTAEGALDEMNTLLAKAKKLAIGSMSDATSDASQRNANNTEYRNIANSLMRIAKNTNYAQNGLLSGLFAAGKKVQIGPFGGQVANVSIANILSAVSARFSANFALTTASKASMAHVQIMNTISIITLQRGKLGALQANVLETSLNSLRVSYENLKSAESTIRDTDFAAESANFTKATIMVQAATSMMSQANQLPQNVIKLLGG